MLAEIIDGKMGWVSQPITEKMASADICDRKHGGDAASVAAYQKVSHVIRERQLEVIALFKEYGELTTAEIAAITGEDRNVYDPRVCELKAMGILERTGQMRKGCNVLRLAS